MKFAQGSHCMQKIRWIGQWISPVLTADTYYQQLILHGNGINGNHTAIRELQLHTDGIEVKFTTDKFSHNQILHNQDCFFFLGPLGLEFGRLIMPFLK